MEHGGAGPSGSGGASNGGDSRGSGDGGGGSGNGSGGVGSGGSSSSGSGSNGGGSGSSSGSDGAKGSPARSSPLLGGSQSASLAALVLTNCIERVSLLPAARRRAAEAERWRLTVAVVRHTVQWADEPEIQLLKKALCVDLGQMPDGGEFWM